MKNNIELRLHVKGGNYYNITNIVEKVVWQGDYRSPCRTLEVDLLYPTMDINIPKTEILISSTCCFYVDGTEVFRGNLKSFDKNSGSNSINLVFKDIGNLIANDTISYNFKNKTCFDCANQILADTKPKIKLGYIAPAVTKISKMFIGCTRYEALMSLYSYHTEHNENKWKYMVKVKLDKLSIIEKGVHTISIQFNEGQNIIGTTYKEDINDFINKVVIVDNKGNKIKESINKEYLKIYNAYLTKVIKQDGNNVISDKEIQNSFHSTNKTLELDGFGDVNCLTGDKVKVVDKSIGIESIYYIDKDRHIWNKGSYTVSLNLSFENVMDTQHKEEDEEKEESNKNSSNGSNKIATDWGHGITAAQLNKVLKGKLSGKGDLFIKYGNMYKFNPLIPALFFKEESGANFDSRLAIKFNNFGGIKLRNGSFKKFKTVEDAIEYEFWLLSVRYVHDRNLHDLLPILKVYAPSSDGNNPSRYAKNLKNWYRESTGKTWNASQLGKGVSSREEANNNLQLVNNGRIQSNNDRLKGLVSFAKKYVERPFPWIYHKNAWCCEFVQACMFQSGHPPKCKTASCDTFYGNYKKRGMLRYPKNYIPKPGDTIFFWSNGGSKNRRWTNHVGLVEYVSGSGENLKIHTIEGNSGSPWNKPHRRVYGKYRSSWARITGYGVN